MNKFRLVGQYDETQEYKCLNCRQHLSIGYETDIYNFKCCPLCLVKWEGELIEKVNPRYKVPPKQFSRKSFKVEYKHVSRGWQLYSICPFGMGTINGEKSAARYAYDGFHSYYNTCLSIPALDAGVRIVLCDGDTDRVLMQKEIEYTDKVTVLEDHYFCAGSG